MEFKKTKHSKNSKQLIQSKLDRENKVLDNRCSKKLTIGQFQGTCWLNSILTCLLNGDKSKLLSKTKLKTLRRQHDFQLNQILNILDILIDKYDQTMSTRIIYQMYHNFDYGVDLLNKLYNYDSDKFNISISRDNSNVFKLLGCGAIFNYQIIYTINLCKLLNFNILCLQKTQNTDEYIDDIYLNTYQNLVDDSESKSNVDMIIIIDNTNENINYLTQHIKYKKTYFTLDSLKFSSLPNKSRRHAISCIKCNNNFYVSNTNCPYILKLNIRKNTDWTFDSECKKIIYDNISASDTLSYNFYKGSTRKIYFYLKANSTPDHYVKIKKNTTHSFLVPNELASSSS